MKHLILGTAGHIDHGKTSLVKALTGIDTDRLKEEKARGITIELGFARLLLPGGIDFGVVDVPGHERFVRTMVAGAGGMDLVMLIIAADEGVMPQTREHLDILRLLGVKTGLVALTKRDMVDSDWLDLVTEEVREFVAGSFLENAPVVPVSSRSGEGLERLREELARLAGEAAEKRREGHFRLPVDRVFTVAGFGTVVTGSLTSGTISAGDDIELLPSGRPGRVRGIQAHGAATERGEAGERLAVNLHGIDLDQVSRGDTVVPRGVFRPVMAVDVRLDHLPSAPMDLKHRTIVRLHTAATEVSARVILLDRDSIPPGESACAQLRLSRPVLLLSGDSYILRQSAPALTIGGGRVLDPLPPRRRRRSIEALELLDALGRGDHLHTITLLIAQGLLSGITHDDLLIRSGVSRKTAEAAISSLLAAGEAVQLVREPRIYLSREAVTTLKHALMGELKAFRAANPVREGISREELKSRLPKRSDARFFTPLLAALERDGLVVADREIVRPAGQLGGETDAALADRITAVLAERGIEPPTVKELAEHLCSEEKTLRDHLARLVRGGTITRISSDLFYAGEPLALLREKLLEQLESTGEITPAEFRDRTGLSRKFLIPLLEYFDREKLTIRVGDRRLARRR